MGSQGVSGLPEEGGLKGLKGPLKGLQEVSGGTKSSQGRLRTVAQLRLR